jgi:cation diffusion facilitator family transporter
LDRRTKSIIRAAWIGIMGNVLLALFKISGGFIAGSWAVIGDGVDTTSDIVSFIVILIAARITARPPSPQYPYGYDRAETIATKLLAFVIFFAGAQLLFISISSFFEDEVRAIPSVLGIYITLGSVIGKLLLTWWMYRQGKNTQSSMLLANAKNMRTDIVLSLTVLSGLFFAIYRQIALIDPIMTIVVSLWIMYTGFGIFIKTSRELMDGVSDTTLYKKIFDAVKSVPGAYNPHRARIRKMANMYLIDLDIEVDTHLNVLEAHEIGEAVEQSIKHNIRNVYDIMVHIEPIGHVEKGEKFGLTRRDV